MNRTLDLRQLALDRPSEEDEAPHKPKRKGWLVRYMVPAGILGGFAVLIASAAGRQWWPAHPVQVVPAIVRQAQTQPRGSTLFQAAGWVEPRPTPIHVPALEPGVVEELRVVEGQQVTKGELLARLITLDAELALEQAEATLEIRRGELNRAQAEMEAAKARLENPVHLQAALADAESKLAEAESELDALPYRIEAAKANVDYADQNLQGKQSASQAVSGRALQQARSDYARSLANFRELQRREPNLQREMATLEEKVVALRKQLELLIEERRQYHEAEAKVQAAVGLRDEAQVKLRRAQLVLDRMEVRAPQAGRVLRLVAYPGMSVPGPNSSSGDGSSTVVEMYDPQRLQVRADVRLENVSEVTVGQPVEVETASSAEVIQGRVLQPTSAADIQKNTLEVKVELLNPPASVRPDMLVTATFLAPLTDKPVSEGDQPERIFVPNDLVQRSEQGAFVWTVDADGLARQESIETGSVGEDGLVEVRKGLKITDKLIARGVDGLQPGDRVRVTGEDRGFGLESDG